MTEFKKGDWAICQWAAIPNEYVQIIEPANGRKYADCRVVGQRDIVQRRASSLISATLIPDFSNAKVGDECFSPRLSHCLIADIRGNWEVYDDGNRFDVSEVSAKQKHSDNYTNHYPPTRGEHPTLFNSFAQFQAYWTEQALEMGGIGE